MVATRKLILLISGLISISLLPAVVSPACAQDKKPKEKQSKPAPPKKTQGKKNSKAEDDKPKRVIVVFPPDAKGKQAEELTDLVIDLMRSRIRLNGTYHSVFFLRSIPTIRRALTENQLSTADVDRPFDRDEKVKRLTQLAGYDMALVTSIDDYQYDADKNQVTIVMSARLIDFAGEKSLINSAGDTLSSKENAPKEQTEAKIASETARTLTEKLVAELLKPRTVKPEAKPADAKPNL